MNYTITTTPPSAKTLGELYLQAGFIKGVLDQDKLLRAVQSQSTWYVARDSNNQVIGISRFISDYARYACIYDVIVDEQFQGMGIGTALMHKIIAKCIELNLDTIHLWPTKGKKSFYTQLGFFALTDEQPVMKLDKTTATKQLT